MSAGHELAESSRELGTLEFQGNEDCSKIGLDGGRNFGTVRCFRHFPLLSGWLTTSLCQSAGRCLTLLAPPAHRILCTCCRHYPGAAARRSLRPSHPAISAFDEPAIGSACTSSFSRLAQRSLTLRPAHSRCHQNVARYPKASDISSPPCLLRLLPAGAVAGWDFHPLESAALSRRTPVADVDPCNRAPPKRSSKPSTQACYAATHAH